MKKSVFAITIATLFPFVSFGLYPYPTFWLNTTTMMGAALLNAIPIQINPSYTGQFDGDLRMGYYVNTIGISEGSYSYSLDMPVFTSKRGNYLAFGSQWYKGEGGGYPHYGENSVYAASVAYNYMFDSSVLWGRLKHSAVAIGVQYGHSNIGYTRSPYWMLSNQTEFFKDNGPTLQIGANFSKSVDSRFNYTLGFAYKELFDLTGKYVWNFPYTVAMFGTVRNVTMSFGANYSRNNKLTWKPALYLNKHVNFNNYVLGTDLQIRLTKPGIKENLSVFAGLWGGNSNSGSGNGSFIYSYITAGLEVCNFRLGIIKDSQFDPDYSINRGGWQVALRWTPSMTKTNKRRTVICNRF